MKKTVIIITAVALLLSGVQSGAKSRTLGAFIEKVNSSLVSFDYSFSMQTPASKSKMTGKGKVKIQGSSFFLEGNGLEVWCDDRPFLRRGPCRECRGIFGWFCDQPRPHDICRG